MRQFFIDAPIFVGGTASIEGDDYLHLTRSLRAKPGEFLRVVDPSGVAYLAEIKAIDKKAASLLVAKALPQAAPEAPLVLALCAPATEAFDAALDAAVQLGVSEFAPLVSARSRPIDAKKAARWIRIARESCCQSLRARLPQIAAPQTFEAFVRQPRPGGRYLAWQEGSAAAAPAQPGAQTLLIGPEGGFDASEIALARGEGWSLLRLAPDVLRVPVAVSAGLAVLRTLRAE